jgi:hypothetical protein
MRIILIVVGTIAMTITTPVVAYPTWTSYYLVQDNVTKTCKVVHIKPTPDGVSALVYESRALAEAAVAEASKYELLDCSIKL